MPAPDGDLNQDPATPGIPALAGGNVPPAKAGIPGARSDCRPIVWNHHQPPAMTVAAGGPTSGRAAPAAAGRAPVRRAPLAPRASPNRTRRRPPPDRREHGRRRPRTPSGAPIPPLQDFRWPAAAAVAVGARSANASATRWARSRLAAPRQAAAGWAPAPALASARPGQNNRRRRPASSRPAWRQVARWRSETGGRQPPARRRRRPRPAPGPLGPPLGLWSGPA